jgi:hypothetical protein
MWWKLAGLFIVTVLLVFGLIPTRAPGTVILYFRGYSGPLPPPQAPSLREIVEGMYLTPSSAIAIGGVLLMAGFAAFQIIRMK